MQLCSSWSILWHCLSLELEWKLTFSSPVATAEFSKFSWHIECSTFTASSFRIWNSSTGIPSPPLDLFVVMLSMAHLTSHSKMSGYRWVITPSWLSRSWRSFLYSSSVYSYHLFLMSSASVRYLSFLSFIMPILIWNVPLCIMVNVCCCNLLFPDDIWFGTYFHMLICYLYIIFHEGRVHVFCLLLESESLSVVFNSLS